MDNSRTEISMGICTDVYNVLAETKNDSRIFASICSAIANEYFLKGIRKEMIKNEII